MYILCRPLGGLNDIFCQISDCASKAKQTGRALIVDLSCSGCAYPVDIDKYFTAQAPEVHGLKELLFALPTGHEDMTVFPPQLQGRLTEYTMEYVNGWAERDTRVSMSIKTAPPAAYAEYDIIVHHNCGGGAHGVGVLQHLLRPSPFARDFIRQAIGSLLDRRYVALHVRNTDYKVCALDATLGRLINQVQRHRAPVLVCSDNFDTETEVCEKLQAVGVEIIRLPRSEIYDVLSSGTPLHAPETPQALKDAVLQLTLVTMCALANAVGIISPPVTSGHTPLNSGFAVLSSGLHRVGVRKWLEI